MEYWSAPSRAASSSSNSAFTGASPGSVFTGASPGFILGLMKRGGADEEEARRPPSLMMMPTLRVRRPIGVSAAGSALTPRSVGEPEEREDGGEEEDEEGASLLGAHARRCCDGAAPVAG